MSRLFPTNHATTATSRTRTLLSAGLTSVLLPLSLAASATAAPPASAGTPASGVVSSAPAKARATMRISGPTRAVPPGRHTIGVRLLADGRYYPNRYVRIEKTTSRGWVQIGRLLTDANGLGRGQFPLMGSTRVRARYDGGATSTTGISPEVAVTVARPKAPAPSFRTRAFRVAAAQSGKPYRYGAAGPRSFDCSGLVGYAYRSVGKKLPRTSAAIKAATRPISKAAAVPGDLIFMPGHVGIYAGDGKMVDSPLPGRNVSVRRIWTSNYAVHRVF
jgi:cell wall-associated NlpC family hydrolase